jgi:polyisoprenoid-binding protein YceI
MSTTTPTTNAAGLPVGTWNADPTHSSASFAVKHMVVATFRGRFESFDATLTVTEDGAELVGTVDAGSIVVKDENLKGHLGSPDFFDVEQYPQLRFHSTSITRDGDNVSLQGELTIKDQTHPITAHGEITGPHENIAGKNGIGLTLETSIDRTKFGLNWNAPLPKGGFAVADDVKLAVELELIEG